MVTASRAMFLAGITGLLLLIVLTLFTRAVPTPHRWILISGVALILSLASQIAVDANQNRVLLERFTDVSESNITNSKLRLVLWGMAVEGLKKSPVFGIGGDNYYSDYKFLRESYSLNKGGNPILEINEDLVPERAHNEYLQILCELGMVGGSLFCWLLAGIGYMLLLIVRKRATLLSFAAIAGIAAFLIASTASSYSFRLPTNGICFFFLLALATNEIFVEEARSEPVCARRFVQKRSLGVFGIGISLLLIGFSLVRALSIWQLSDYQNTSDPGVAEMSIRKAISLDPSEPMFRFYYGQSLYMQNRDSEAVPQLRFAIDYGLATSTVFFNLAAAQMLSGKNDDAAHTFEEALRVYPRSVFLRTGYASFLKRAGRQTLFELENQEANEINEKQARSWQLAHDEGLERLVQTARVDDRYAKVQDLLPESAPLALASFQRK
jgi:Tfp pilus assembly protein PilF